MARFFKLRQLNQETKDHRAVDNAQHTLDVLLAKTRYWQRWATTPLNEPQVKLLNKCWMASTALRHWRAER